MVDACWAPGSSPLGLARGTAGAVCRYRSAGTPAEQAAREIRLEAEARDLRLAAESYGKRQRQLADEEARRIVADAEASAKAVHADEERRWQQRVAEVEWLEAKRSRIGGSLPALSDDIAHAIVVNGNGEPEDPARAPGPGRPRRGPPPAIRGSAPGRN